MEGKYHADITLHVDAMTACSAHPLETSLQEEALGLLGREDDLFSQR